MNTSAVAKLLGVSPSTIQRWVKQANLQMERTELGHYQFSKESIEILKDIKDQLNSGVLLQDLKIKGKKLNKATAPSVKSNPSIEKLLSRVHDLEYKVEGKADDIVSYQILQHRREIEDLQNEVSKLKEVIESLYQVSSAKDTARDEVKKEVYSPVPSLRKFKKRNILTSFFGF